MSYSQPQKLGKYEVLREISRGSMGFVDGGKTLKDFCRPDNLLPVEKVIEIVFKCAKALDYAHWQGIVHRDIKVAVKKRNQTIRSLGQGDCFGEMGYLTKTTRTATIVAEAETALLKINPTVISQVLLNCQVRFLKVFLRTLIHRLSATTERMSREN